MSQEYARSGLVPGENSESALIRDTLKRMSEDNVAVVREWFRHLTAGDPAPELCHSSIEIKNWAESPVPGPFTGHEGLHAWWRAVNDPDVGLDIQLFELEEILPVDNERVVTIQRATGRGRYSGLELDQRWGSVITVEKGQILSAVGFASPEDALKAAGLHE